MFSSKVFDLNTEIIIKQKLIEFINNKNTPFTTVDIKHFASHELGAEVNASDILKLIKTKLDLSFKRVSSRPVATNKDRIDLLKKVFCLEYGILVDPEQVIVNIDEATFSRSTKINYSWGRRGK